MRKNMRDNSGNAATTAVIVLVFVLLFTIFVLQNADVVEINFFFWRASVSRVVLLLGSGLVGGIVGFVLGWSVFGRGPASGKNPDGSYGGPE